MEINHNKIYMKVMNNDEIHYGYQYKAGLNIDTNEFNDNIDQSCCKGRLYITTIEKIPLFISYGDHIRLVKIPEDARIIDEGDKLGCDKIILLEKISFAEYFDKWFDKDKFDWSDSVYLCRYCSRYFDKWFDKNKFDWSDSRYLCIYCCNNFLKWFYKDKFKWKYSGFLCEYCSSYFDKWFDKDKFDWKYSEHLYEYCSNYKHIWGKYVKNYVSYIMYV